MFKLKDGSVTQGGLDLNLYDPNKISKKNEIVLARIDEVVYADDPRNTSTKSPRTNKQVQYNLTILEGSSAGGRIFNVIDGMDTRGDGINYYERIRRPTTKKFQGPAADTITNTDGEYVLVAWLGKSSNAPVIIGNVSHPAYTTPANKADGLRIVQEYNGIKTSIDKNGAYIIENMGGPKDEKGEPTNSSAAGAKLKLYADGTIEFFDGGEQKIEIKKDTSIKTEGKTVEIKSQNQCKMESDSTVNINGAGHTSVEGGVVTISSGGPPVARIGDLVMVTGSDSNGDSHAMIGQIITGSSKTIVGG